MYITHKFRNDKTYVTSQEQLNVVRKSNLKIKTKNFEILEF